MVFPPENEKEETGLGASGTQPILKDPIPTTPTTQLISTVVKEEGEDIIMTIEKLDRYFLSPSAGSTSSPISKHLEVVHEHLSGTFPIDPVVSTQL